MRVSTDNNVSNRSECKACLVQRENTIDYDAQQIVLQHCPLQKMPSKNHNLPTTNNKEHMNHHLLTTNNKQ